MIARILSEDHPNMSGDLYDLLDLNRIIVPGHWTIELSNALATNIRRGRISMADLDAIAGLVAKFEVTVDTPISLAEIATLTTFADAHGLTVYDASYVKLAAERGAPLATVDAKMRTVAQKLQIPLIPS